MKQTKFITLVRTLSPKELVLFCQYVEWTETKVKKHVLPLLSVLRDYYPLFPEEKLDKRRIFQAAFPQRVYDGNFLRKQTHVLYQALKNFLIETEFSQQRERREQAFLTQLQKRKCYHLYELGVTQIRSKLVKQPRRDQAYYYDQFKLAELEDQHFAIQQQRVYDPALQHKSDYLDLHYIAQKLRFFCEMYNRSTIISSDYRPRLLSEIMMYISAHPSLLAEPPIAVYHLILKTLQAEDQEDYYPQLVAALHTYHRRFSQEEMLELYRYAQNFCIRRINQGQRQYLQSLFELFQAQLATRINIINGYLPPPDYKNITTVGLQLGESDWVKGFLEDYKTYLPPREQENNYNYNLAVFYYSTQAYAQAIDHLKQVQFTDAYLAINSKIILLKTYYIQADYYAFYYLLDAFKISLRRNKKVATKNRLAFSNFLIQFRKLAQLKEHQRYWSKRVFKDKGEKLAQKMAEVADLYDRKWLIREYKKLAT